MQSKNERGFGKFSIFLLLCVLAVIGAGFYGFSRLTKASPFSLSFFEKTAPEIIWESTPKGLGADPVSIALVAKDPGAGLDEVVLRLYQKEAPIEIFKRSPGGDQSAELAVKATIDAKRLGLKEGSARLVVSVFDKSIWSNSAETELTLPVSFTRPRVEVLTPQQNGANGGTELVFYRVVGRPAVESGVEIGSTLRGGIKATALDPAFAQLENLYFALFPIPTDFDDKTTNMRVIARDDFGNVATSPFNYRIQKKKFSEVDMQVEENYLSNKISEIMPSLQKGPNVPEPNGDLGHDFKIVNETIRLQNEEKIRSILAKSSPEKLWSGPFIRPLAAAPKATFAEKRTYKLNGKVISQSAHMGVDLADVGQAIVHAANKGKILYADDLGIYGRTVLIDHGTGIATLYGHMSSFSIKAGDDVAQGQEIGQTGATGLAGGDHLHYEIRVQGTPVSPFEWWDAKWIKDHIEDKIFYVQKVIHGVPTE